MGSDVNLFAAQRVHAAGAATGTRGSIVNEEIMQLRRALDSAIYSLEQIKRRAISGATSDTSDWDCLVIAEAAEAAIERIAAHYEQPKREASHPALENEARYRGVAVV
jgi:hypothetical protein